MQERNETQHTEYDQVDVVDKGVAPEERNIYATVPSHTVVERRKDGEPHPETYRQALRAMLGTPEIEQRLNYITASMIVTIFGGWLASRAVKSRGFTLFLDILLLFLGAAIVGILLGILLGEAILPVALVPFLLLATAAIVIFLIGFGIRGMWEPGDEDAQYEYHYRRQVVVPARRHRIVRRIRTSQ